MKQVFLIGLMGLAILMPCIAQQAQTQAKAAEGLATRYSSQDTVFYASHARLPFGTQVKVTNLENNKTVIVQIGGRIPQDPRWLIDICAPAAEILEMKENQTGFTRVRIEEVPKAAKRKATRKFMQTGVAFASTQLVGAGYTAAHPSIPLGSWVRITNKANGSAEIATVTNRISADGSRIIDLSRNLAQQLALGNSGDVMIETVDKNTGK
jgi:rare lipoprotein A (peptidoglycan hydrolase)